MIKAARTAMVIILGLVSTASVLIILAPDEENGEFIIIGKTYAFLMLIAITKQAIPKISLFLSSH